MAALSLHHVIFASEKDSSLPLRSASSFLRPAPERNGSPTSHLFSSTAYQDLIQRQPTHPSGPTAGWDLGLNLLGDPVTAAEHKSLEVHQKKMRLRRLHAISIVFEVLFGVWGTYTTVRYCLAFGGGSSGTKRVCALVLGIISALAVALVTTSVLLPLLSQKSHPHAWRFARSLLRACYLILLTTCAVTNLVLVLIQHPSQFCGWDIDISWYTITTSTATSPCHAVPLAVWIVAAVLRLVVTTTMALSFIYILRSYYGTRHPAPGGNGPTYTPYISSDPEELSPMSISSPLDRSKSTFKFTRSQDSSHTLSHSSVTLPKSSSISTLAPSTSCTGHSRSHSNPPPKDMSPPSMEPPASRRTSSSTHLYGPSPTPSQSQSPSTGSEMPSTQTQQPVSAVAVASPAPYLLRRTSRISVTQVAPSDTMSDIASSSRSERLSSLTIARDSSEIRSSVPWKPSHRGTGVHLDAAKKTTNMAWENHTAHVRHVSQASTASEAYSSSHDDGRSSQEREKDKEGDDVLVYSYGYGASGNTYPYLDMYNPQGPRGHVEASSSSSLPQDADARGFSQGHRRVIPCRPGNPDVSSLSSSEPRSSLSRDHEALALHADALAGEDEVQSSSGEEAEEEYVAMMGGFVRRMATIESLGSREAAGTLSSTKTGAVPLKTAPSSSLSSASSHFSSVRFAAAHGSGSGSASPSAFGFGFGSSSRSRSGTSSFGALFTPSSSSSKHTGSLSTAYLSFSSGGTDMMHVNERGELLSSGLASTNSLSASRGSAAGSSASPHDHHHRHTYTASGSSLPRMDDCDEDQ